MNLQTNRGGDGGLDLALLQAIKREAGGQTQELTPLSTLLAKRGLDQLAEESRMSPFLSPLTARDQIAIIVLSSTTVGGETYGASAGSAA